MTDEYVEYNNKKHYLSAHEFPYELGVFGDSPIYTCENLSGYFRAIIHPYEYDKEYTKSIVLRCYLDDSNCCIEFMFL